MPTEPLTATVRQNGDVAVIDLSGEINVEAEAALNDAYAAAMSAEAGSRDRRAAELRKVTYINSTGIALIVGLLAKARQTHTPLMTCGLSDHYREIFEITRLSDFMSIASDEASALAGLPD
jgi:anti-anti-sigma factor